MLIQELEHIRIGGSDDLVCHWPRQGGLWRWGEEILCGYIESPCHYRSPDEVGHGQNGIWSQGYVRLRRSRDCGQTWSDDGVLFDNSQPVEEQRRILKLDDYQLEGGRGIKRADMDMTSRDAIMMMGRSWCGDPVETDAGPVCRNVAYCFRSSDRGSAWEETPSVVFPNHTDTVVELANNTMVMPDGRLMAWLVGFGGIEGTGLAGKQTYHPQLYASEDHGVSWHFHGEIYSDPNNRIAASYPHVVVLPSGRWICVLGCWFHGGGAHDR